MVLNDIINQAAAPRGSADAGSASATTASRKTSRKISMFLNNDDGDEGPNIKEKLVEAVYKLIDIFCVWDCCHAYIRLSEVGRGAKICLGFHRFAGELVCLFPEIYACRLTGKWKVVFFSFVALKHTSKHCNISVLSVFARSLKRWPLK